MILCNSLSFHQVHIPQYMQMKNNKNRTTGIWWNFTADTPTLTGLWVSLDWFPLPSATVYNISLYNGTLYSGTLQCIAWVGSFTEHWHLCVSNLWIVIVSGSGHGLSLVQRQATFQNHNDFLANYRKTSNISHTLIGNKIVDNSDVFGASPVGAAPTTSSFST